jgi:hypothetical protein
MQVKNESGQAVILVAVAMSIFLIGAVGLGIDGAHMYAQRQMAQTAADSAAIAGIMSIFNKTNVSGNSGYFSTSASFTCTTTDTKTPCQYASKNGFGANASDTVTIDFPGSANGVTLSPDFPVNVVHATVSRSVNTTLMRLLGPSTSTISAEATAAITYVNAPVPILVTHPTLSGSFSSNGTTGITICGGPSRSIQINSNSATADSNNSNTTINLSHAGPPDPGNCTTGTGADFAGRTTMSTPGFTFQNGTTGHYVYQDSLMQDPLANVSPPPMPTNSGLMGTHVPLANGTSGCPASPGKPCQLFYPGVYTGDVNTPAIDGKGSTPVFVPGIYYLQSAWASQPSKGLAMDCSSNCDMYMATGFTDTYTGTGWSGNVLFYNTGLPAAPTSAGRFNLASNATSTLVGSPANSSYQGILLFQDRSSVSNTHSLGGGGAMTLQGTIYLTNTIAAMSSTPGTYQALNLQGGTGSGTLIQGEIIVGALALGGNSAITMNLNSNSVILVSQVALVK